MYELTVRMDFAAAHRLDFYNGKCEKLHGHNWQVMATVQSKKLDQAGLAIDFKELKKMLAEILELMDHAYLNEIPELKRLNPTSENLARYIAERMAEKLNGLEVKLRRITVWESEDASASYLME